MFPQEILFAYLGAVLVVVFAPGPEFPADAETNTPAAAALKNATETGSSTVVLLPEMEKLRTSTPSETAASMASTMALV